MSASTHCVTIVIPTSGRPSLQRVTEGIAGQTLAPDQVLIIEDRDRRGPGWARNRGMEQAVGDIIALLDDDTVPPPEWLASMRCASTS